MRRAWWFGIVPVAVVVLVVTTMVLMPAVEGRVEPDAMRSASASGWRASTSEETEAGPLGIVGIKTRSWDRPAAGAGDLFLGKFYVVSIKAPVWLPSSVLRDVVDEQLQELAAENGVALTPVPEPDLDGASGVLLEYKGSATATNLFAADEVGVIARLIPCDAWGNVVVGAGFATSSIPSSAGNTLFSGSGTAQDVYNGEVKAVLAPAVGCP